jgi:hypothetical protein
VPGLWVGAGKPMNAHESASKGAAGDRTGPSPTNTASGFLRVGMVALRRERAQEEDGMSLPRCTPAVQHQQRKKTASAAVQC